MCFQITLTSNKTQVCLVYPFFFSRWVKTQLMPGESVQQEVLLQNGTPGITLEVWSTEYTKN